MNMSVRDGFYWGGFMIGAIGGALASNALGFHRIIGTIVGIVVGVGIGFLCEKAYTAMKNRQPPPDQMP